MKLILAFLFTTLAYYTMGTQSAWSAKRILYVFDQNSDTKAVKDQLKLLAEAAQGCEERDIEIIQVFDSPQRMFLEKIYKYTGDKFMIVLVGKDGKEKYRTMSALKAEELFSIIDAMPMRQYEIRSKS